METTKRFFTTENTECEVAYKAVKQFVLGDELIYQLMRTGTTSNLESYHGSLYHKNLLDKDKNPQVNMNIYIQLS